MQTQIPEIHAALSALGEILEADEHHVAVVIVGGTALILQGFVSRATQDVDVIALGSENLPNETQVLKEPEPLPGALTRGIARVARDFNLPVDWMNTTIGLQWKTGLPPGLGTRVHWQRLGGLWLGLADRYDLIFLKLYAAADSQGPSSVHYQDLLALNPTRKELQAASTWVRSQDPSSGFGQILDEVLEHIQSNG
ncbi:MAG: hypothetical protein DWQ07_17795 [Chloroflexi bacterium]|nr:MAG: hypothetical protein DWQ07_17795 [Chloroflexota bacterium]